MLVQKRVLASLVSRSRRDFSSSSPWRATTPLFVSSSSCGSSVERQHPSVGLCQFLVEPAQFLALGARLCEGGDQVAGLSPQVVGRREGCVAAQGLPYVSAPGPVAAVAAPGEPVLRHDPRADAAALVPEVVDEAGRRFEVRLVLRADQPLEDDGQGPRRLRGQGEGLPGPSSGRAR
jgi:hypothetical protein